MSSDYIEQPWWVFEMPHGVVSLVPAGSEASAREVLSNMCYPRAPVHDWPLTCTRFATRASIVQSLLGRPFIGQPCSATNPPGKVAP
jgi:hypothetical protein